MSAQPFDARAFVEEYFASMWDLLNGGVDELRKWVAEDYHGETPYSPTAPVCDGVEAYAQIMAAFRPFLAGYEIRIERFHATTDPNVVVVEARGGGPLAEGGEYWNDIILVLTFKNGKLWRQREYFNPLNRFT